MRNLKFVADHLKTKEIREHAVKKLSDLLRYAPDQYKTQQMCDNAILENGGALKSVPDCYKNHKCVTKQLINTLNLFLNALWLQTNVW